MLSTGFPTIRSKEAETVTSLDRLMDRVKELFDLAAQGIGRSPQHVRSAREEELRLRAVSVLVATFRQQLGHAFHFHVATIAEILSGIPTDADYVKKVERRAMRRRPTGDKMPKTKG